MFPLIRIGSENDSRYLIPDDLNGIAACFCPGVDINSSFAKELLKREGMGIKQIAKQRGKGLFCIVVGISKIKF